MSNANSPRARPILVTGAPRSGTTFMGRMLAESPSVLYLHEPFNPDVNHLVTGMRLPTRFYYVTAQSDPSIARPLSRTLALRYDLLSALSRVRKPSDVGRVLASSGAFIAARRRHARPLLKDALAIFSSEWLADTFGSDVIVMIRHPAAVAASFKRLGWEPDATFRQLLSQPKLMIDLLSDCRDEVEASAREGHSPIERVALLWKVQYHVVSQFRSRHPDWIFMRHEDLAAEPVLTFEQVYDRLGLDFTPAIRERVFAYTSSSNEDVTPPDHEMAPIASRASVSKWQKSLTDAEVRRVKEIVEPVSSEFYSEDEW